MAEQDDDPTSWCDEDKAKVYNWVFPAEGAPAPEATAFDEVALGSRGEGDVFDLREQCPPCYRQGKLGSCTANALAFAYEFDEHGLSDERFRPSRLFIYYNERAMEKSIANDKGAQISDGVKTMEKEGVCPENMWPYDIAKFADRPPQTCYEDAQLHKVTHAKSIQQTIPQLKAALVETKRPFVFGFVVYASFETKEVAANGVMPMPAEDEKKLGGHAVAAVGYDDGRQAFIVRNSWGDGWGDGGYFYMPYSFISSDHLAGDFWSIERVRDQPGDPNTAGPDQPDPAPAPTPAPSPHDGPAPIVEPDGPTPAPAPAPAPAPVDVPPGSVVVDERVVVEPDGEVVVEDIVVTPNGNVIEVDTPIGMTAEAAAAVEAEAPQEPAPAPTEEEPACQAAEEEQAPPEPAAEEAAPEPAAEEAAPEPAAEEAAPEPAAEEAKPATKKEGFFARKKREAAEWLHKKNVEAQREAEEAGAKPATVVKDYLTPSFDTALAVAAGATVSVLNTDNADWWKVSVRDPEDLSAPARVGFVPASYLKMAEDPEEAMAKAADDAAPTEEPAAGAEEQEAAPAGAEEAAAVVDDVEAL
jgi:hypothetical protein